MGIGQFLEKERVRCKGPTRQEMMKMQRRHEQDMRELDRRMPTGGKVRKFVFTR